MTRDSHDPLQSSHEPIDILAEYEIRERHLIAHVARLEEFIEQLTDQLQARDLLVEEMQGRMRRGAPKSHLASAPARAGSPWARWETLLRRLGRHVLAASLALGLRARETARRLWARRDLLVHGAAALRRRVSQRIRRRIRRRPALLAQRGRLSLQIRRICGMPRIPRAMAHQATRHRPLLWRHPTAELALGSLAPHLRAAGAGDGSPTDA